MQQQSKDQEIFKKVGSFHLKYFIRHNPEIDSKKFNVPKPILRVIHNNGNSLGLKKFEKDFLMKNVIVKSNVNKLESYLDELEKR